MRETICTGQMCVGDLRLSPLDMGHDLRLHDTVVQLPDDFRSVGLDRDGETVLVEGTRTEMIEAIQAAGYRVIEYGRNRMDLTGTYHVDAIEEVEIEYLAEVEYCRAEGADWNSPRVPAHYELHGYRVVSATVHGVGGTTVSSDAVAIALGMHVLDALTDEEIMEGLQWPENPEAGDER